MFFFSSALRLKVVQLLIAINISSPHDDDSWNRKKLKGCVNILHSIHYLQKASKAGAHLPLLAERKRSKSSETFQILFAAPPCILRWHLIIIIIIA